MLDIDAYNDYLGKIYIKHEKLLKYSPTLTRCEGQSYAYFKYLKKKDSSFNYIYFLLIFLARLTRDSLFTILSSKEKFQEINEDTILIFSYFDHRCQENGYLKEEYFRDILDYEENVICLYKLISPGFFFRGYRYLKLIKNLHKRFNAKSEYSFIRFKMIVYAFLASIRFAIEFLKIRNDFGNEDSLNKIISNEIIREILTGLIYQGYLQEVLYDHLLKRNPKVINQVWENQPWNRILETSKKAYSPNTVSKGFQHTGFSKKLLQHYPSNNESDLKTYPDTIISNGEINAAELKKSFPQTNIIIGSALRQTNLINKTLVKPEKINSSTFTDLAYAFSWDSTDYEKILEHLNDIPKSINIHLKFHPIYPNWVNKVDFQENFINSKMSWEDLSKICSLFIVNDNSLMFESYYYGINSVVYDGADDLELEYRDFGSPLIHLERRDLSLINNSIIIDKVNESANKLLDANYLERYFVVKDKDKSKEIFL